MASTRRDIAQNPGDRDNFRTACQRLKTEMTGVFTSQLDGVIPGYTVPGPDQELSTYDLFVVWHHVTMELPQVPTAPMRNMAHGGPTFLPWHRFMLTLLELHMQRVLGDPNFGLPYWDWAADGSLTQDAQRTAPLWTDTHIGGNGVQTTGPFSPANNWRVRVAENSDGQLQSVNRQLWRDLGGVRFIPGGIPWLPQLPTKATVAQALPQTDYDNSPWSIESAGFRNVVEGWDQRPRLHNLVHVWIGGDMGPGSSPNDPAFFLNHCNVDRIWAAWQVQNPTVPYAPTTADPDAPAGQLATDPMVALISQTVRPVDMEDVSFYYGYDNLNVAG